MPQAVHDEVVELLLASMTQKGGDGLMSSFFFGKPGAPHWERRMGTEVYYRANKLTRAALHVRQQGPAYLRYVAISDIWSMLQGFIVENYWYLANETFLRQFDGTYAENVSKEAKTNLANALAISEIFQPRSQLTIFPIIPVQVRADFESEPLFLIDAASLNESKLPPGTDGRKIAPNRFPPLSDWKGKQQLTGTWLGVRSPAIQASNKMKAAVLGALALTPMPRYRYMFSGRTIFGGRCTFSGGATISFGQPDTPPLMHDIVVTEADHAWLDILASKLMTNERSVRRQLSALEYFYRAWELGPSERFPILCMALDAIFGEASQATRTVIEGVRDTLGPHIRDSRLRQLMELRASVIHGGAPDVYDSRKYARYYDDYEADPIHDLELVVASCLRARIFSGALVEHSDPNAEIIAEAQAKGRLPRNLQRRSILEDDPASDNRSSS